MKITNLPIAEASDQQLRDFARQNLGLDILPDASEAEVRARVANTWDKDWIPVVLLEQDVDGRVQAGQPLPDPQQLLVGGAGVLDPKVRCRFGETQLPGGKEDFPIGVNGHVVLVKRRLVVDLPYRFYLAHQNAVREEKTQDPRSLDIITTEISNYPLIEVIAMPSPDQIAEFHARTDDELMPA